MSLSIDTVTIGGVEDRRMVLNNADAGGYVSAGVANWTKIRIGVRWALDDTGGNIGGTPRLYLGVHQSPNDGFANGPVGALTSFFLGFINNSATFTRNAGPPVFYSGVSNLTSYGWKNIGGFGTVSGTSAAFTISGAPSTNRSLFIVEIQRNASNVNVRFCGPQTTIAPDCADLNILKVAVEMDATNATNLTAVGQWLQANLGGTWNGNTVGTIGFTLAQSEVLNAVAVGWEPGTNLRISDLYYSIIQP